MWWKDGRWKRGGSSSRHQLGPRTSITLGERADSSEAICLSFRANLLRPSSSPFLSLFLARACTHIYIQTHTHVHTFSLFISLFLSSRGVSYLLAFPTTPLDLCPFLLSVCLLSSFQALFSTPHHSTTPHPTNVPHKTWYQRSSNGDLQSLQAPLSR